MERKVDASGFPDGAPRELIDQIVRCDNDGPLERDRLARHAELRLDPSHPFALIVRIQESVAEGLRFSVSQGGVVREGAPEPMERRIHVRTGAHVVEPSCRSLRQEQVETVRMTMTAPRLAVVE